MFIYTIYHYIYDIYIYRQGVDVNVGRGQKLLRRAGRARISKNIFFWGLEIFVFGVLGEISRFPGSKW